MVLRRGGRDSICGGEIAVRRVEGGGAVEWGARRPVKRQKGSDGAWTGMEAVDVGRFEICVGWFQGVWHGWLGGRWYR